MRPRFDKAKVDYLVAQQKCITEIPSIELVGNYRMICSRVFEKGEPPLAIASLEIDVRVPVAIAGVPGGLPGAALKLRGHRIRGLDYEMRHDNPDGSIVRGWHEHLWSPEFDDDLVRSAQEPKHKDLRGVFKAAMALWNIQVIREQLEVE